MAPSIVNTDQRQGPRDALRPLANGKLVELGKWVITLVITAMVAYFTAQTAIENRLTIVETRQQYAEQEVLRRLDRIENKLDRIER
jgi:hypothetical protein